ncbi:hypothetical protein C4D60_Mb01t15770 [Musa balbisiana]|uniref:AB hydrolase-1 domain-containing protein n=1 Tax=Musa balbisiana TaxID=52838 RepID=A0A4S8JMW2_MUSBA|nr:hypothetical protein C4D60_Mb01t15770 [Musa balbisiana]
MESPRSLRHRLRLLALAILSLLYRSAPWRLISLVALWDFVLHLAFLLRGLRPVTLDLGHACVHLWVPAPARGRPRKPALVLVHGFGGNSRWQWEGQIGPLSRSFDLYIPDLVFFGNSRSASRDRSLGYQASCIAEAMQRLGVARYSVVGISYGGFVAFRMAEGPAAGAVERVAILTAGICLTPEQLRDFAAKEERDVCELLLPQNAEDLMNLLRRSKYRHPKWIPTFLLQDFIEVMYRNQRMERSELLKKLLEKGIDLDPIPVLNQDTLILWGDKDDIFPLPLAHRLHSHLSILFLIKQTSGKEIKVGVTMSRPPITPQKRRQPDSQTQPPALPESERILYELIKSRKSMGIWTADMKREADIQNIIVTKALESLQSKNLIKDVVNVHNKSRKIFMTAEFEPSKEVSGGSWYSDGSLDTEFINILRKMCLKHIEDLKIATIEDIHKCIAASRVTKVECTMQQVLEIVRALALDKEIEELKSTGVAEFSMVQSGKICYRRSRGRQDPSVGHLSSIPCGMCPRISECTPEGVISPNTCVYYQQWLKLEF